MLLKRNADGKAVASDYDAAMQTVTVQVAGVQPDELVEVTVLAQNGVLLASADRHAAEVRRLLHAFRLESLVKWRIDRDLPQLLSGELTLARYVLTPGQQQALHQALDK